MLHIILYTFWVRDTFNFQCGISNFLAYNTYTLYNTYTYTCKYSTTSPVFVM